MQLTTLTSLNKCNKKVKEEKNYSTSQLSTYSCCWKLTVDIIPSPSPFNYLLNVLEVI
jgi:hypothetical protein